MMLIRYGFNIEIELTQPAAVVTAMDVHSSARGDILRERDFRVSQPISVGTFTDAQGNILRRFNAQPGRINLDLDGIYECDGRTDIIDVNADITPVNDVPLDVLPFLQGSRYCETDLLSDLAWRQFGGIQGGWAKVQAVCDFVHNALYFDYQNARPTRTAGQALEEGTGVCRDFTHLAMTLCRCLNIPADIATAISATSASRPIQRRWISMPGSRSIWAAAGTRSIRATTSRASAGF